MANSVKIATTVPGAKQATGEIKSLSDAFTRLQKGGAKGFAIGVGAAATTKAFSVAGQAIGAVTDYLKDSAQAFREDELSIQRLTTSLRANVVGWDGNTQAIDERIKAGQALGFSDEAQRESVSGLVAAYGNVTQALDVMRIAQDLARFSGVDLATASDVLVKVHAGSYRALKQLGISTAGITNETQALAAIQKVVSGQAEDYAQTLTGKLAVAEEKAGEASEKFGKSVAQLQSFVLPAAADAVSWLADQLEDVTSESDRNAEAFRRLGASAPYLEVKALADSMRLETFENERMVGSMGKAEDAFNGLGSEASAAERELSLFPRVFEDVEQAAKDAAEEIDGFTDSVTDAIYGAAIAAGKEQELKDRIRDLAKELAKTTDKGDAIKLKGQIAELRQSLFELHLEEAVEEGPEAAIEFLERERKKAGAAKDEIDKLIQSYRTLARLQGKLGPIIRIQSGRYEGKDLGERASGGPVSANSPYIVGEQGPELMVPSGSGTIVPNGALGGSGGGSTVININVSTPALTPGGAEALARAIGPALGTYMRGRGWLAT